MLVRFSNRGSELLDGCDELGYEGGQVEGFLGGGRGSRGGAGGSGGGV